VIVNFRATFPYGFGRKGGIAGKRDETHVLERLRYQKMQVFPSGGHGQDGYFFGSDANDLCDFLRYDRERGLRSASIFGVERARNALQFRHKAESCAHGDSLEFWECNQEGLRPGGSRQTTTLFSRGCGRFRKENADVVFVDEP